MRPYRSRWQSLVRSRRCFLFPGYLVVAAPGKVRFGVERASTNIRQASTVELSSIDRQVMLTFCGADRAVVSQPLFSLDRQIQVGIILPQREEWLAHNRTVSSAE